ncbi:MAG: aminotransferase class IV [Candidatus Omnitrophota bacterium]|nr:aminotransferase class IV [Candidatus Omnitrophota bacterium]
MQSFIFLNGKFLDIEDAKILVSSSGLFYGWGLFETMRSYNGKIIYLDRHLERLKSAAGLVNLKLSYPAAKLKKIIKEALRLNFFKDAYVKLILWKNTPGTEIALFVKNYKPPLEIKYKEGFSAAISSFRQDGNSLSSRVKSLSRFILELAFDEARSRGFDEALLLNTEGYIAEGTRNNIFFVKGKIIFTPSLDCGCLNGVTRKVIFDLVKKERLKIVTVQRSEVNQGVIPAQAGIQRGYDRMDARFHGHDKNGRRELPEVELLLKIAEGRFALKDLYNADEAFLTNSLIGVMPLVRVENYKIAKGVRGEITEYFIKEYNCLLNE